MNSDWSWEIFGPLLYSAALMILIAAWFAWWIWQLS